MVEPAGNISSVGGFVLQVGTWLAAPIWPQFKYLYNYNTNFGSLQEEIDRLKDAKVVVQRKVEAAERNLEVIEENVKKWQTKVNDTITEADQLIEAHANNPRCLKGLCPNLKTRYKHSKKAFKLKRDDIGKLLLQEEKFDRVSYPTTQRDIWLRFNEDYLAFESRNSTVKNVWDSLNDEKIYMMGVYGMGGLGKTTLVQEIGRKAEKDKLFDEIIFVEITENPDTKKIQTRIANKLGLKFEDAREDEGERASKLYSRMEYKNILLIIDNIWEELALKMVGIPSEADRGRNKILMTTRDLNVLEKMGSANNFRMGTLNEEESWSLFKKMAGNVIQARELKSLSKDVCNECGGLPIVICTIAKTLKNKSRSSDWKVALQELKAPSPIKFTGLLEKEYVKIALSYKYLRDDELKKTFLISSLMENNTSISNLFRHVVHLDILEGANLTIEDARDRLDKLICELKDSCLLLDGFTSRQFAMHDVVRAVAVTISYTDHHVFTGRNDVEREWKDKDKLKKCTKISLPVSSQVISQLWPKDLDCLDLEYFYMTHMWDSSYKIPDDFFTVMSKLKVLILFGMQQLSLPSSIDLLTNLQTLCLDDSKIEDVAVIAKLKKLKVLSLKRSNIKELPTEIGQLAQLRLLDLSNCRQLEIIVPNVISKLSQLEELYTKGCHIQWKVEVLKELEHLSRLANLEIEIKDNKILPKDFFSKELKRCKISIGNESWYSSYWHNFNVSRMLEFKYDSTIFLEELRIFKNVEVLWLGECSDDDNNLTPLFNEKVIFPNLMALGLRVTSSRKIWDIQPLAFMSSLTHLILKGCRKIKYAFPFCIAKSLQNLQHLEITDCEVLEEIVVEEGAKAIVNFAFPQVTFLRLEKLPQLKAFYRGIQTLELPMLKRLVVEECEKFSSKYSLHISELKFFCLEYKINSDMEKLELTNELRSIRWNNRSQSLEIKYDKSTNIPLEFLKRFQYLEELKIDWCEYIEILSCGKDEKQMQITLGSSSASFQNLKVLNVRLCTRLMKLMTPSTTRSLVQLREMRIEYCDMLVEIVENEGDATRSSEIVFANLKKLSLQRLESLVCFCFGNYSFNFPSLEELIIGECPSMKIFSRGILTTPKSPRVIYQRKQNGWNLKNIMEVKIEENDLNKTIQGVYKKQADSNLEELRLSGRDIKLVWEGEFQESFGKVKTLELVKDEYANIPIQILHKFNFLEKLILKVSSYEDIFSFGKDEEPARALTKLKILELRGLSNLKCIWKQDLRLNSILQNLNRLEVHYCHNLTILLPSLASFENLTTLKVRYCNGMQNLMSSSTAKSLVRLEELSLDECEMMIKVVANEGDTEKGEIVFEKLKKLSLYNLKSLTCFLFGDYTLKFPFLEKLYMDNCPKMKTFSGGDLSMPKLKKLNDKDCSESNLDTITQQLQNDCSESCEKYWRIEYLCNKKMKCSTIFDKFMPEIS